MHARVLNEALEGIPPEKVRVHLCWGNYAGTHHRDVGAEHVLPTAFAIRAQGLSFENANSRHAGDHGLFRGLAIPKDKVLYPGVVDTCATSVESAEIVCQRICNFAQLVGPDRVVACTDCGFATTAEAQGIPAEVAWMKLRMLVAGARQASAVLFPKVVPAFVPRPQARVFHFCSDVGLDCNPFRTRSHPAGSVETRLILVSELSASGQDAARVASHIRLFVDVPFALETDATQEAESFLAAVRLHLADGKRRNCPLYPLESPPPPPPAASADSAPVSPADMVLGNRGSVPRPRYEVVVVGSGVVGLLAAHKLLGAGVDVCVLEREAHVGGIWTTFANATSQVNSSEGSYRLCEMYRKRANRDHSSTSEIRRDILRIARELSDKGRLFTGCTVEHVDPSGRTAGEGEGSRKVYSVQVGKMVVECEGVILAVNDRVGQPRPIEWPGREEFGGQLVDGFGGDAERKGVDWAGKRVVIVGMGAFAVENARTALENGAAHVTVVCRRHGTVCPKVRSLAKKSASMIVAWHETRQDERPPFPSSLQSRTVVGSDKSD